MEKEEIKEPETLHQLSSPTVGKSHNWQQRGTTILCTSCETPHAIQLKPGYQMTGLDKNGLPIIKKVWYN